MSGYLRAASGELLETFRVEINAVQEPGFATVDIDNAGSYLAFREPEKAEQLAAAITEAAQRLREHRARLARAAAQAEAELAAARRRDGRGGQ
jgi:hypothetical protein